MEWIDSWWFTMGVLAVVAVAFIVMIGLTDVRLGPNLRWMEESKR